MFLTVTENRSTTHAKRRFMVDTSRNKDTEHFPDSNSSDLAAGYVALVGRPNVGKSTLLNALIGEKLTAVTHKPQTTRFVVRGILHGDGYQIVLEDTPGFLEPRKSIDRSMMRLVRRTVRNADVIILVIPPFEATRSQSIETAAGLESKAPVIVAINKIDLVSKDTLLPLIAVISDIPVVKDVVPISAKFNDGLQDLLQTTVSYLPHSEPLYPPEFITDQPERFFAAEILREQLLIQYHEEIPYSTAVSIEEFRQSDQEKDLVRALLWVERESQRRILIGHHGGSLKRLGTNARKQMELLFGRPVYLELWVKVRHRWRDNERDLISLGFDGES